MARTIVGLNDAKAVKKWSASTFTDVCRKSYFTSRFIGDGPEAEAPICRLNELEKESGEQIQVDLSVQIGGAPVEGDNVAEGTASKIEFYSDNLYIDQLRKLVSAGGKMTRKRTIHNLRERAKALSVDYWSNLFDEEFFMYLSGTRGANTSRIFATDYTGFANNAFSAPDSEHLLFQAKSNGTAVTAKTDIDNTCGFTLSTIDRAVAYAEAMEGGVGGTPQIQPCNIEGEGKYVCVMSPYQAYALRKSTTTGDWLDIQKALATSIGKNSPICKGGLGEHNGVVLHKHNGVRTFSDFGNPATLAGARALFMGKQAGAVAFGSSGTGLRFDWSEDTEDHGNELIVITSTIMGVKKVVFNGKDFGVMAMDSYAVKP